jgi:hypothetical protein
MLNPRHSRSTSTTDKKDQPMLEYKLEHIFSYYATVTFPEMLGPVPDGLRLNFYITGGEMTGPRVIGKVHPVGADWLRVRRDGVSIVDVRGLLETQDGALIDVTHNGIADAGEDCYERTLASNPPPNGLRVRTMPCFYTAHPQYAWLNRLHCLGIGEIYFEQAHIAYDIYAVR